MPLAAPKYKAGWVDPQSGAQALFKAAGWIYRRCNEILEEAVLDPVKLYDLASNCFLYRLEADKWIKAGQFTEVGAELVRLTQSSAGVGAKSVDAINEDYKQLYDEAQVFLDWMATMPKAGDSLLGATVIVNRSWPNTDFKVRIPKTPEIQARVQILRDVFL